MRRALPVLLLSAALPAAAQFSPSEYSAAKKDPKAFTVDETTVEIVKLGPTLSPSELPPPPGGGDDPMPILDSIINIGTRIWSIVVANKPVVDVKNQYATALPEGLKGWASMGGWRAPQGTIYGLVAKNAYGATVINVRYQVLRTAGGNYKGVGKYLTAVTVEPLLVEVAWGYKFSMDASVPDSSVVNVGTTENPVAAMMPQLSWRISTPIKDSQGKGVYYIQGDGAFREIGGPFRNEQVDLLKSRVARAKGEAIESLQ